MARKFSEFDNSTSPASTDNVVGFRPAATNVNKRWTWSSVVSFLQGILDITRLNRSADNYVEVTGAGSLSNPTISTGGVDANINLAIETKGSGSVRVNNTLQVFDDLQFFGSLVDLNGGDLETDGGDITTAGGSLNLGAGNFTMAGGALSVTGGGTINLGGGTTLDSTTVTATNLIGTALNSGSATISGVLTVLGSMTAPSANITNLTTNSISTSGGTLTLTGTLSANTVDVSDVFDASDAERFLFSSDLAITADVSSVQGGGLLSNTINVITTCANAGDCVTLPSVGGAFPPVGQFYLIRNDGANSADIFPNTGAQINALGANNAFALAAGSTAIFFSVGNAVVGDWTAFTI